MATNIYFIGQKDKPNWFGVGETKGPLMIEEYGIPRRGSDYNKSRDACVVYTEISFWKNVSTRNDIDVKHDKIIHDWLETIPGITKVGTESFIINAYGLGIGLTHEKIAYMIEQEFFPKTPKTKKDLTLKKHQQEFVNKVLSTWEEWKEFLLFAKCRAGKSIMTLSAIVESGIKLTLAVSRYTCPIQSWRDDSKNFSKFNNLVFINLSDKDYLSQIEYWYNTDKQLILWSTIQGNNRWDKVPYDVDLIVYDEAHQGYGTSQWKKLCKRFPSSKRLYVTGTAFSLVWDFSTSNRFIYSYFEEQRDKKLGLNNAPTMRVVLAVYESEEYKKLYGDDPDAMKNLFCMNELNTDFMEPSLVQDFYSKYFGEQKNLRPTDRLMNGKFHIFMALPSVAACHASVKYLEKTKFAPLVVTGETKENPDTIRKHVAENEYTVILTVSANVLGVTVPEIDTIINATEGESINFWTQFAFRGGSSDRDWDVIDFCPQRCLNSLRMAFVAARDNDPTISEYTLSDFVPISEWSNGFKTMTQEQIIDVLSSDIGNSVQFISGAADSLDFEKLSLVDIPLDLISKGSKKVKSEKINDNGANGSSNKKIDRNGGDEKIDFSEQKKKQETIRAILERIPLVLYHCIKSNSIPANIDSLISTDHYYYGTPDKENILGTIVSEKIIDPKTINYRIDQVIVDIQHSMRKDECMTLEKLSCSNKSQLSMPVQLVNDLLDDLF